MQDHGIRVNGLAMGWTLTPGEDMVMQTTHGASAGWEAEYAGRLPLIRLMRAEAEARAICYLATDASAPMTGSIVTSTRCPTASGICTRASKAWTRD